MVEPNLYKDKEFAYYGSMRREILPLLPQVTNEVLELGCGTGATLDWLKKIRRCQVTTGIELAADAAEIARGVVDTVIVADIERDIIDLPENKFDLILCLDVLEHTRDPWSVLKLLVRWLRKGGIIIASIPNVRYRAIVFDLLFKGKFEYQNVGILDRSHLRFFTKDSAIQLMKSGGLEDIHLILHPPQLGGVLQLVNVLTMGYFRDMFSWQIIISGKRCT